MQGVKGGEDRPKPDYRELESETCKQMRKAGYDRAQAEELQKKGLVNKLQATTSQSFKDVVADKMDKLNATIKGAFSSER